MDVVLPFDSLNNLTLVASGLKLGAISVQCENLLAYLWIGFVRSVFAPVFVSMLLFHVHTLTKLRYLYSTEHVW